MTLLDRKYRSIDRIGQVYYDPVGRCLVARDRISLVAVRHSRDETEPCEIVINREGHVAENGPAEIPEYRDLAPRSGIAISLDAEALLRVAKAIGATAPKPLKGKQVTLWIDPEGRSPIRVEPCGDDGAYGMIAGIVT